MDIDDSFWASGSNSISGLESKISKFGRSFDIEHYYLPSQTRNHFLSLNLKLEFLHSFRHGHVWAYGDSRCIRRRGYGMDHCICMESCHRNPHPSELLDGERQGYWGDVYRNVGKKNKNSLLQIYENVNLSKNSYFRFFGPTCIIFVIGLWVCGKKQLRGTYIIKCTNKNSSMILWYSAAFGLFVIAPHQPIGTIGL